MLFGIRKTCNVSMSVDDRFKAKTVDLLFAKHEVGMPKYLLL